MFTEWFLLVAAEPEERCGSVEHSETAESGSGKHCLKMIIIVITYLNPVK